MCLRFEQLQGMGTARNRIPNSLAVNNRSVYCLFISVRKKCDSKMISVKGVGFV